VLYTFSNPASSATNWVILSCGTKQTTAIIRAGQLRIA